MKGADTYDFAIPDENKKIPEMVIELAEGPGEDPSPWGIEFD
jgi:hypothetical protein